MDRSLPRIWTFSCPFTLCQCKGFCRQGSCLHLRSQFRRLFKSGYDPIEAKFQLRAIGATPITIERGMALIDDLLPSHQFSETHSCRVATEPATMINAVPDYRPDHDRLFKVAIALRELPMRLLRKAEDRPPPFGFDNFTLIGRSMTQVALNSFWGFRLSRMAMASPC